MKEAEENRREQAKAAAVEPKPAPAADLTQLIEQALPTPLANCWCQLALTPASLCQAIPRWQGTSAVRHHHTDIACHALLTPPVVTPCP